MQDHQSAAAPAQKHRAPAWAATLLAALAFALGFASDAFTAQGRINLLPPALLGLLAWNLVVYVWLAIEGLRGSARPGALRRALEHVLRRLGPRDAALRDATQHARGDAHRLLLLCAALLHVAALAWALGALASVYWHGVFLEYLAGWSSTFIRDPATLHALLSVLLWPATALAGATLPDAAELARLRFSLGPGENAARWIHWYALTTLCAVVLPRALLALVALQHARRLAADRAAAPAAAPHARLLPYSYQLPADLQAGLRSLLDGAFGPRLQLRIDAPVTQGSEDEPERWLGAPAEGDETLVLLFALTATPEAETHGAFLAAVAARQGQGARRLVLIDESGFRARFTDDAARLAQRRAAWERLLAAHGERPAFVDLAHPRPVDLEAALLA